ncbi:ATP phosphoribosyltransferase [candidate division KSB1 bacterium]|nr:ATP phosphoribosyltransferase [candidate division KSB1 bacterium]RQW05600.1 MAG: ATP phosphoribosyltransferase [candidate division KSB1 bacterium]
MTNLHNIANNVLKIGLPKGSLQESTFRLLAKAGYHFHVSSRSYFPSIEDDRIQAILIRAQEIARYVEDGVFDVGLTGKDWILENRADVVEVASLTYSKSTMRPVRWVLAVPNDSSIQSVKDLQGKRVATEIVNLTTDWLKKNGVKAEVEFSWGATEVKAPTLVDAIVEVTETGSSLKANNLRIVETILESRTMLIANKESWHDAKKREKIENFNLMLQAAIHSEGKVGLKMNVPKEKLESIMQQLPAMKKPTISPLYGSDWMAVEIITDETQVRDLIPALKRAGAQDIIEYPLNKVIH